MGERIYFLPCCYLRKSAFLVYVVFLSKPGTRWKKPRALGESHKEVKASKVKRVHEFLSCPTPDFFFNFLFIYFWSEASPGLQV